MILATSKHVFKIKTCRNLFKNYDLLSAVSALMYKLLLLPLEINIGNNQQIVAFQIENFWELDVEQFAKLQNPQIIHGALTLERERIKVQTTLTKRENWSQFFWLLESKIISPNMLSVCLNKKLFYYVVF